MSSFRKRTAPQEPAKEQPKTTPTKGAEKPQERKKGSFVKLGAIIEKKDGEGVYLKLDGGKEGVLPEITVNGKKVTGFQVEDPTVKFDRMVAANKMSRQEAEEAAANVPTYVLFELQAITE